MFSKTGFPYLLQSVGLGMMVVVVVLARWLVYWSLTALSTQCRSYFAFKVRLY